MQLKMVAPAEVLEELNNATSRPQQLAILRAIKNSITGHELRKIEYVRAGLTLHLSAFLSEIEHETDTPEDVAVWVHVTSILAVVANSGAPFVTPIIETDLISQLFDGLQANSTRIQLAILRCLNTIADNLPLQSESEWKSDKVIADALYAQERVERLSAIIRRSDSDEYLSQQAAEAVLVLICQTCASDRDRVMLASSGVLHAICDQLSRIVEIQRLPIDGHRKNRTICHEASSSLLLETLAVILEDSETNAQAFATHTNLSTALGGLQQARDGMQHTDFAIPLPKVPDHHSVNAARRSQFPPLSAALGQKRRSSSMRTARGHNRMVIEDGDDEQQENPVGPWLLSIVRNSMGRRRFAAARLIGQLKCHGLISSHRSRSLGVLLVPILVQMLFTSAGSHVHAEYSHLVPSILALVVRDNEHLQRVAFETKAINKCVHGLKASYEAQQSTTIDLWYPHQLHEKLTDGEPERCLGLGGLSQSMRRTMAWRCGLLQALASIVPDNESYRKEVIDLGGLPLIMQALEPFSSSVIQSANSDRIVVRGSSPDVLVAACGAIRALTRSPTALRTKLVDADVAKPIIKLLQTAEPKVRIAATMVLSNLAHDFSPMKQNLEPVLRKLCEQAHSANARLRYESLFALKAMVHGSKNELKRKVVEELGPNWIKHLIATDPHDVPAGEVIGLVPKEYRKGSMVRLSEQMELDDEEHDQYQAHTLAEDLNIQAELLAFLRNLTTGERPDEIIEFLLEHIGQDDFLQVLLERLKTASASQQHALYPTSIIFNTIYVLVHLCAADKRFRRIVSSNVPLMKNISTLLGHAEPEVRCAACWLVTNLIYVNNTDAFDMVVQRARELGRLGVVNQIRRMEKSDPVMDVKERAATASECFSKLLDRN